VKFPLWLSYTLLRVLLFAVPLAVLLLVGVWPWLAALIAAVFGLSASVIFLRGPREAISREIHSARTRERPVPVADDEAEDAAADAADRRSPPPSPPIE
jgi:hypothetical protein